MTRPRHALRATVVAFLTAGVASFAADESRHLILITLDTTRADHLGVNGSKEVATPHLDRMAREGVNFTRARSPVPLTLPAHASILTGRVPPAHGVRDNGAFRLSDDELTLAEVLRGQGYATAAFVSSFVLDHRFGLAQGFDVYDDRTWSALEMLESLEAERNGEDVYEAFHDWLVTVDPERPFFVWVHLFDPHAPYEPPEPFRTRYPDDPYAGEVAFTDAVVGKLLDALEARSLLDRSIVAVVGDHGEGLGEHGEPTHGLLIYNSTLHVPMLIRAPGLVAPGSSVETLTRTIDLAPTLLDYLGVDGALGEGESLRPRIEARRHDPSREAYGESLYASRNLGWSELRSWEAGKYRFIEAPRPELYDLSTDPGETENLAATRPGIVRQLRERLEALTRRLDAEGAREDASIDPEVQERLRSLGYVAATPRAASEKEADRVDPKDKLDVWNEIQHAMFGFHRGDFAAVIDHLERTLASEKDIPLVYEYLGSSYLKLGLDRDAEKVYRAALARGIESAGFHVDLGRIHGRRNQLAQAERELRIATTLDPRHVTAYYELGDVLRAAGRVEDAITAYRDALAINPDYVYAWNGLGMSLARLRRNEGALDAFREVVRVDPRGPRGYFNLAVQLERMRRAEEALRAYERFLALAEERLYAGERERAKSAVARLEASR